MARLALVAAYRAAVYEFHSPGRAAEDLNVTALELVDRMAEAAALQAEALAFPESQTFLKLSFFLETVLVLKLFWSASGRFRGLTRGPRNTLPKSPASLRLVRCQQQSRTDKFTINSQQLPATYHKPPVTSQQQHATTVEGIW